MAKHGFSRQYQETSMFEQWRHFRGGLGVECGEVAVAAGLVTTIGKDWDRNYSCREIIVLGNVLDMTKF